MNQSSTIREIILPETTAGQRLDRALASCLPELSRATIQQLMRDDAILVDGTSCTPSDKAQAGAAIQVKLPEPEPNKIVAPEKLDFSILFEDEEIMVVNKPPGMTVHPNRNERTGTLVHGLLYHAPEVFAPMLDEQERPGIVHRLGKDTSGGMAGGETAKTWKALKTAFKDRRVEKKYLTLVLGEFGAASGRIEAAIGRHPKNRKKMAVLQDGGKHAVSNYRVLGENRGVSFLEVTIETGRTHQIRVHFANLNHPVLGDHVYGGKAKNAPVAAFRQMLHARQLIIPHPRTGEMREFIAPLPDDFKSILAQLEFPIPQNFE